MRIPAISQERGNSCRISGTGRIREPKRVGVAMLVAESGVVGEWVGVGVEDSVEVRVGVAVGVTVRVGVAVDDGDGVGTGVAVGRK